MLFKVSQYLLKNESCAFLHFIKIKPGEKDF